MLSTIKILLLDCLTVSLCGMAFMFLFNSIIGINGIARATPLSDGLALIVSALLVLPYLLKRKRNM